MNTASRQCVVVVSRPGYDELLGHDGRIDPLAACERVFFFSQRTAQLAPQGQYAEMHVIDLAEPGTAVADRIAAVGRRWHVAQVVSICEDELLPVVAARQRLGLPGIAAPMALRFRDKLLMKAAVPPALMRTPDGCAAGDADAVRRLFAAAGRILAKPRLGSGARGIEVLTTAGAVDALLGRPAAQLAQLLVERFIDGAVLHLDAVVRDGRLLFSSLGRYEAPPLAFGSGAWSGTRFTNAASAVHDLARQKLRDLLQAWDVRDGVFHWEFFDTGSDLVFGEIAIRPPGGGVSRALYETFGVHLVQEHLRVQLGMASALDGAPLATAHGACLFYLASRPGVFVGLSGSAAPGGALAHLAMHVEEGQAFAAARHSADSLLACSLRADSAGQLTQAMVALKSGLLVRLQDDGPQGA